MPISLPPDSGLPPAPGKPGGIGDRLETNLVRFATRLINNVKLTYSGIFQHAAGSFLETFEREANDLAGGLYDRVLSNPELPPDIRSLLERSRSGEKQAGIMTAIGLIIGVLAVIGPSAVRPLGTIVEYVSNHIFKPMRLDYGTWRRAWLRDPRHYPTALKELNDQGWTEAQVHAADLASEERPGIAENLALLHRGLITETEFSTRLNAAGVNASSVAEYLALGHNLPGPGDLIRMAVREGWNDQIAGRFGYDADLPPEFVENMKKQGFDPEWSRRWWRAHWELPGPTQARDMLHRTSMTEGDYALLLKTADYPAQWRQWMIETAYEPYTRVDIRRMFQVGVLKTYGELVRAHMDIGYDLEKAQKLSDFTVLEYGETEREATKTEVLNAYGIGRLTQAETRVYLADMGYPDWVVETYITRVDLGRVNGLAKQQISHAKTMYVNGQMTRTDVYTALGKIPLTAAEIERYLDEWEIQRTAKITRPSRSDLLKFFLQNEVTEADFRTELRGWRLSDRYIEWYIADAKRKLVLAAQAEKEAADAEALKVRSSTVKTATDIQIADIAVQIAQLNLTIADLKASSSPDMSLSEIEELSALVVKCQIQIKELQLQKANVWKAYLVAKGGT